MKMLLTTHNSIVFPDTLPNEALDFFNQMLSFDIQLLLLNKQLEQCKKHQLDEKKVVIDKTQKELVKEKSQLMSEFAKVNRKKEKITLAIGHFMATVAKRYQVKNNIFNIEEFLKKLLFSYNEGNGDMNQLDLFDEEKDDVYKITPEQKDFMNFFRSQDETKIHYANKLESDKKNDEWGKKFDELNKKIEYLSETILKPYHREIENYNQLKEKKDLVASQKEKVFKEFLEKMDDASLQEHIEQLVQSLR
jgi:hypothetical protein